jgi:photosystem II Psb27 protein
MGGGSPLAASFGTQLGSIPSPTRYAFSKKTDFLPCLTDSLTDFAYLPSVCQTTHQESTATATQQTARRDFLKSAGAAIVTAGTIGLPQMASAEVVVPEQTKDYTFPTDWGLTYNYENDAARVRNHMVIATGLAKGADKMEDFGKNMKKEMVDFVSYYRRFPKVAGKPSFSTLYTSINVLAGHYTSYGFKYPLPEKRRKRLYQEYAEIEKSLKRGR